MHSTSGEVEQVKDCEIIGFTHLFYYSSLFSKKVVKQIETIAINAINTDLPVNV